MFQKEDLTKKIKDSLESMRLECQINTGTQSDYTGKECSIPSCDKTIHGRGLCNAHYIHFRNGGDMNAPVQTRNNLPTCVECGRDTDSKSAWNRCSRCYKTKRRAIIKSACVEYLGSICSKCQKVYPNRVLDFHHVKDKAEMPSFVIDNFSIEKIADEIVKCILLCANCHREEHCITSYQEISLVEEGSPYFLDKHLSLSKLAQKIRANLLYNTSLYTVHHSHDKKKCSVAECSRPSLARELCNTHYIRMRAGKELVVPTRNRKDGSPCITCGDEIGRTGGWQRCASCYSRARADVIKAVCVEHLGGLCKKCGSKFPQMVYDFHHLGDKDHSVSYLIFNSKAEEIAVEVSKCEVLCANCHRLEHNN